MNIYVKDTVTKKQLFAVEMMNKSKVFDNNYFTISCLAQCHVQARVIEGEGLIEEIWYLLQTTY